MSDGCWTSCHRCQTTMWVPAALNEAALRDRGVIHFYCAYGHGQVYAVGQTEEEKLRLERDRLKQQLAEKDDTIRQQRELRYATERRLTAQKGLVTRVKNRVGHGVCPCCTRTFENLQRHMASKHPNYATNEDDLVAAE